MKQELLLISGEQLEQILTTVLQKELKSLKPSEAVQNESEEIISFNETRRLLKISAPTLYKRMKDGTIPYKKVGKRLLFSKQSILKKISIT